MAQSLPDAPQIVTGLVIANEELTDRQTGEYQGQRIVIMSQTDGAATFLRVKIDKDDARLFNPTQGVDTVAIWARSAAYDVGGNSGMSSKFVRRVTPEDLSALALVVEVPAKA
jgi:hypothetical protein